MYDDEKYAKKVIFVLYKYICITKMKEKKLEWRSVESTCGAKSFWCFDNKRYKKQTDTHTHEHKLKHTYRAHRIQTYYKNNNIREMCIKLEREDKSESVCVCVWLSKRMNEYVRAIWEIHNHMEYHQYMLQWCANFFQFQCN